MATPELHDATFSAASIDWAKRTAAFDFETVADGPVRLEASGVTDVSIPHRDPWGSSVSVNELRRAKGGFEIEMQSGDVIVVGAADYGFV